MNEGTRNISLAMPAIAEALDTVIEGIAGERIGFTLIVFTEGRASYISSITREEGLEQLKVLIGNLEAGVEDVPAHLFVSH